MNGENRYLNRLKLYIALGNSLTVGVGANYTPGFVERYQRLAETALNRHIFRQVFARRGATTEDILNMIRIPQVSYAIREASILTLSAGGNDLIHASEVYLEKKEKRVLEEALQDSRKHISATIAEIRELKSTSKTPYIIRVLDLYNPLPQKMIIDKWVRLFNRHLRKCCAYDNIAVTNLYTAFKGREDSLLAADRIHPNPEGYQVIAEELNRLGYAPLN